MEPIKVKIVNKSVNDLPIYATVHSAGMDLKANFGDKLDMLLTPGSVRLVPTGLYVELPDGYEAQIRPRSGMALKTGITVLNSPGTIDSDYRGEIGVILINHSDEALKIRSGDRIAQMVISKYERVEWKQVETLEETERGAGGFGHTGVK